MNQESDTEQGGASSFEINELGPAIYAGLRRLATSLLMRERQKNQTLQITGLVSEAVTRMASAEMEFKDQRHFFASFALTMRRVLVDQARRRKAAKRASDSLVSIQSPDEIAESNDGGLGVLEISILLDQLKEHSHEAAECILLHYFGGYSIETIAQILGLSSAKASRQLQWGKAWIKSQWGKHEYQQ